MKTLLTALGFGLSLLCLQPAALRAEDLPKVKATEEKAIRALVGKKAIITGRVIAAKEAKNGMTFLDFEGGKFLVVAWKEDYANFEGGSPAKLYNKKEIEVTGTILDYKGKNAKADEPGKLEIKLKHPDQVKIAGESGAKKDGGSDAQDTKKDDSAPKNTGNDKPASASSEDKKAASPESGAGKTEPPANEPKKPGGSDAGRVDPKKYFK